MDNYKRLDQQQLAAVLFDLVAFGSTFVNSKIAAQQLTDALTMPTTVWQDDRERWHVKLVNHEAG